MDWEVARAMGSLALGHARRGDTAPLRFTLSRMATAHAMEPLTRAGRALDHLLWPRFRRQEVRAPVFIVAPPRSGTTLLFNLLEPDPRFVSMPLYASMMPAISVWRLARGLAVLDARWLGGALARRFAAWQEATFGPTDDIHRTRFDELEEDVYGFILRYADLELIMMTSLWHELRRAVPGAGLLDERPERVRRAVMRDYLGTVRRAQTLAPDRTFLTKNVYSWGRLSALSEAFPDARFIHIVRHPARQLPSAMNLIRVMTWGQGRRDLPPAPPHPMWDAVLDDMIEGVRRVSDFAERAGPERVVTLRFDALVADPLGQLQALYDRMGWPADEALLPRAREAMATRATLSRPGHVPALHRIEDWGMDRQTLARRLPEVYARYALEP